MAVSDVRTFWSAFVRVLLECIARCTAALGLGARTRTSAGGRTSAPAAATAPAPAPALVAGPAAAPGSVPVPRAGGVVPLPAPRRYESRRARSLPPTMKQRIRAEAHGSSPTSRNVLTCDDTAVVAIGTSEAAAAPCDALVPAARRRDAALCG